MKELDLFTPISRDDRQKECLKAWVKHKCVGTIEACTGFGKTRVGLNALNTILKNYPNFRYLVVVPTEPLKVQWMQLLDERGLSLNGEVKIINTVVKHDWTCNILIIDEIHRAGADILHQVFQKVNYKYILGLTATFERLDGKHELINKYCPVVDSIPVEVALFNGWVSQYKEYAVLIDVDDLDTYNEYNREFFEHFEFFNHDFSLVLSCTGPRGHIGKMHLRDVMCPNGSDAEKSMILKSIIKHTNGCMRSMQARKKFVNNHPKKLEIARKIIEARSDKKIITFSNNVKMAESIGIGDVYTGRTSKKRSKTILEDFNNTLPPAVLNSVARLNEGADLKGLSVAIHLGIDSSKTKATQKRGRVIRFEPNKQAENFILVIRGTVEEKWLTNAYGNKITKINEEELDKILKGEEVDISYKPLTNLMFRF